MTSLSIGPDIADIAAIAASFAPGVRRQIVAWLAPLEHIVRKLLLAETATLHQTLKTEPARLQPHHGAARAKRDPAQRQTSRATFALSPPRDPLLVPDARAPRIRALWDEGPPIFAHALTHAHIKRAPVRSVRDAPVRLARRLEALQRVLENPLPHVRRLARTGDYDKEDPRLAIDAISAALHAPDLITDSS